MMCYHAHVNSRLPFGLRCSTSSEPPQLGRGLSVPACTAVDGCSPHGAHRPSQFSGNAWTKRKSNLDERRR